MSERLTDFTPAPVGIGDNGVFSAGTDAAAIAPHATDALGGCEWAPLLTPTGALGARGFDAGLIESKSISPSLIESKSIDFSAGAPFIPLRTAGEWVQRIDRDALAEVLDGCFPGCDGPAAEGFIERYVAIAVDAVLAALPDLMGGVA